MEKQKIKDLPKILLILSVILFILSLFPLNMVLIIGGIVFSSLTIVFTIIKKNSFTNNTLLLVLIISSIALLTDISFLYYVIFMIWKKVLFITKVIKGTFNF